MHSETVQSVIEQVKTVINDAQVGVTDTSASITRNVFHFTAVWVESSVDTARWRGVKERVLVSEFVRSIDFFHQLIANVKEL